MAKTTQLAQRTTASEGISFKSKYGSNRSQLDLLGFCAQFTLKDDSNKSPTDKWEGQIRDLQRLEWAAHSHSASADAK